MRQEIWNRGLLHHLSPDGVQKIRTVTRTTNCHRVGGRLWDRTTPPPGDRHQSCTRPVVEVKITRIDGHREVRAECTKRGPTCAE